jgi:hypothetical protein
LTAADASPVSKHMPTQAKMKIALFMDLTSAAKAHTR